MAPKQCTLDTELFNPPEELVNVFSDKIGICPTEFGIYKIPSRFSPNVFLTAKCADPTCKRCLKNGTHSCVQLKQNVTATYESTDGEFREVYEEEIDVGCVCASENFQIKRGHRPRGKNVEEDLLER